MARFALSPADPVAGWREGLVRIGSGEIGGKANGLVFFRDMLEAEFPGEKFPGIEVAVPAFAVLTTDVFDAFTAEHGLASIAREGRTDAEIAAAFQAAPLPREVSETFAALLADVRVPLAVRSSSVLEDAIFCPFAGVYETKMIPNHEDELATRLERLELAIKLVFASTYFGGAVSARAAMGKKPEDEKMAVIVQEVVGNRHGERFYPLLSGVARSHDFYPAPSARPEDGVVNLALGLGKTIADGGLSWSYSPARPKAPPPYGSIGEVLKNSQLRFWCLNLDREVELSPAEETEFLLHADLATAETDGVLHLVASTYDGRSDRLVPGTTAVGPRVLNFAPLLTLGLLPWNDVIRELLAIGERAAGNDVEIEFALREAEGADAPARLGFVQIRPMHVSHEPVGIDEEEWSHAELLLRSERVMGNGTDDRIRDVVYVEPAGFEAKHTRAIASEVEALNRELVLEERPYLLIGFGRWGSSDPWLGIPVDWSGLCGARVIVEATLPTMNVEPSQGSHLFHNLSGCGVSYVMVHHESEPGIDWNWLRAQPVERETRFLRRARFDDPLRVKIDGRQGRGIVRRG